MSRHAYYHAYMLHRDELQNIWVRKTPNPSWGQNMGFWVGYESIMNYYGSAQNDAEKPDPNAPKGVFMHTLTTPIIEVAGDGKTAKGIWYTARFRYDDDS